MLTALDRQAGEMSGYPSSATGYPANFQIGLATAADSGLPNAQIAWSIFDSRSVKPSGSTSYNNYPNFAVIPRSSLASAQPPPTMPPALNPPPTTSNPPLVTITTPPVPKERPARKCASAACSTAQPSASKAEPARPTGSTPPSLPGASNAVSGGTPSTAAGSRAASGATQTSAGPVRILVRVICIRFDTWCSRYLPQRLHVPAQESARPQAAAGAPARTQYPVAASPVAPRLTSTVSVTRASAQDATARTLRR